MGWAVGGVWLVLVDVGGEQLSALTGRVKRLVGELTPWATSLIEESGEG